MTRDELIDKIMSRINKNPHAVFVKRTTKEVVINRANSEACEENLINPSLTCVGFYNAKCPKQWIADDLNYVGAVG